MNLKTWNVNVTGLGGPFAEFNNRTYQIDADTPGDAVNESIMEFKSEMSVYPEEKKYDFYSAEVTESTQKIRLIDRSKDRT